MKHLPKNGRKGQRALSLALVFLMLAGVLSIYPSRTTSAAEVYEYDAFSKPAAEVDEETLYKKQAVIDDFKENVWEGSEFVKNIGITEYSGNTKCLLASADSDIRRTLGVKRDFAGGLSLEGYGEIMFAFIALGGTGYDLDLEIVLTSGEDEHVYSVTLIPNEWHDVFLDISGITQIDSVEMTAVAHGASAKLTAIALSAFTMGDTSHGDFARRFYAIDVSGAVMTKDAITVTPEGSDASVKANAVIPSSLTSGKTSTVMLSVKVSGLSYAKLSFGTSSDPVWKTKEYAQKSSVTVTADSDTYVSCFTVEGDIVSWELSFTGIIADGEFTVDGIEIVTGGSSGEDYPLDTSLGSVTRCSFVPSGDEETIQLSGKLTRDAAVRYIDGEVCLFMIPAWASVSDVLSEEPLMSLETSTEFTFSVGLSSHQAARASRFIVALRNSEGTVCMTSPISPVPLATAAAPKLASSVAYAGDTAQVFSSGADGVVLDIPLDRLILSSASNNAVLTAWGDSYIYLDRSILTDLSSAMEFYSACGIGVYFRLCVSQTDIFITSAGKTASGYALDVSTKQNADMLCATVEYLSLNYAPAGYMIGYSLNSAADNCSALFNDIFAYSERMSAAVRCIYTIAASHDPQAVVLLPFDSVSEAELASSFGELPAFHKASYCAALFDYYMGGSQQTPVCWAAVTSITSDSAEDITPSVSSLSGSGYLGTALALDERNSDSESPYAAESVTELYPNALSLFVSSEYDATFAMTHELYYEVHELPYEYGAYTGTLGLWDFTKSFMTHSWTLSDGTKPTTQISSALTDVMPLSTCRALHLVMDGTKDGGDIIAAAKFPYPTLDIAACSYIEFMMTAESDSGGEVSFTITVGNSDTRYIFPVTVKSGVPVSVTCHVEPRLVPEYFAISADGDSRTVIDIASVSAHSDSLTDDQLLLAVTQNTPADTAETAENEDMIDLLIISSLVLFSAVILAALSRKKR